MEMPYLNRKFVCSAETAHDAGKVDGGEESEQVKDDHLSLPAEKVFRNHKEGVFHKVPRCRVVEPFTSRDEKPVSPLAQPESS